MNPTEAKSFIWTVFFCIVVVCVVAVLMSFPAKASAAYLIEQNSINANVGASLHIQEFSYATTTRIQGILLPNGTDGNLTVCKGSIESATDYEDLNYLQQCMNGLSETVVVGYDNCTATSTGNFCAAPIVIQGGEMYYFVYFQDSWQTDATPVHKWFYDGSPADPYPDHDACFVQNNYDGLGGSRATCNYFDISWFMQIDGDMTFKVVYDPNDNSPLYNASDIFGNLNLNVSAGATCMPTHCYRNDTCYLEVLYNDLADGSDFYTQWDENLDSGVTPDYMYYTGTLTSDDYGTIWDQPSLHYIKFAILSANQAFGSSTTQDNRTYTKRACHYVDANSDWYGAGNGDPDNLDTMGCDCEITYHNEEGLHASNLFYQSITPQECASSTLGECGLTDVECGLKKAANWVICPEEDKVTEFYNAVQAKRSQYPYNFVAGVTGGLNTLRATTSASIPLIMIGKNGVRGNDEYLITPSRWLDPKYDDLRYWYFKIFRTLIWGVFLVYVLNRLFNAVTGGTKDIAENQLKNQPEQKIDKNVIYAVGANRFRK